MVFNFTFLIYISGTIVFSIFVHRIAKIYQEQKTKFTRFFLYGTSIMLLFYFFVGITSLFFTTPSALRVIAMISIFLQSLAIIFLAKSFYPVTFTKISIKLIQLIIIFLALTTLILYYLSGESPSINPQGLIDWNINYLVGIPRILMMVIVVVPALIIFSRQLKSEDKEVRKKSILFSIFFIVCLLIPIPIMVIFELSGLSELLGNFFVIFIIGIIILLTRKPKRPDYLSNGF